MILLKAIQQTLNTCPTATRKTQSWHRLITAPAFVLSSHVTHFVTSCADVLQVAQRVVLPFVRHAEGVGALLQDADSEQGGVGDMGQYLVSVHSVTAGSQAEFRGLRPGDSIVRVSNMCWGSFCSLYTI